MCATIIIQCLLRTGIHRTFMIMTNDVGAVDKKKNQEIMTTIWAWLLHHERNNIQPVMIYRVCIFCNKIRSCFCTIPKNMQGCIASPVKWLYLRLPGRISLISVSSLHHERNQVLPLTLFYGSSFYLRIVNWTKQNDSERQIWTVLLCSRRKQNE